MARGLLGRLEVGSQRRRLDVPLARGAARVDVDGHQGLGLVDDQVPTGLQWRDRRIDLRQMILDPMLDEQGRGLAVGLNLTSLGRHQHPHEVAGLAETRLALHQDLVDVLVVEVADGPLHEVLFLIDQGGGHGMQGGLADVFPQPQQVVVVALDLSLGPLCAGGADDQAHALRDIETLHHRLQALAVRRRGDLP